MLRLPVLLWPFEGGGRPCVGRRVEWVCRTFEPLRDHRNSGPVLRGGGLSLYRGWAPLQDGCPGVLYGPAAPEITALRGSESLVNARPRWLVDAHAELDTACSATRSNMAAEIQAFIKTRTAILEKEAGINATGR